MAKRKLIAIIILLFCFGFYVHGQSKNPVDKILDDLQNQASTNPVEKVYLHLDKQFYSAGDTIWFKAYVVVGAGHRLSAQSGVLYVELLNNQSKLIRNLKLPVINGVSHGDVIPGDTISEGNYRLRAYTNWMRNAGPDYFFDQTLSIGNAISNKVFTHATYAINRQTVDADIIYTDINKTPYAGKAVKYDISAAGKKFTGGKGVTDANGAIHIPLQNLPKDVQGNAQLTTSINLDENHSTTKTIPLKVASNQIDLQFFPEGGQLVNDLTSKIAFKAIGTDGLGKEVRGTITDDQNNTLTEFASTHLGMGYFFLTPQTGRSYKANIIYADGSKEVIDLPKANENGYVMSIHADEPNITVKINSRGEDHATDGITLVAESAGNVYAQAKGQPGKSSFTAVISKSKLPSGIVRFTLFSGSGEPLNERLVFVQNDDLLRLAVDPSAKTQLPRQPAKFNLNIKDASGKPVTGNFSVAVIDESKVHVDENTESTILSNLLLTSDIKGYIEKPNYYFANVNPKTTADLDVLMMTQGYHRFEWKQITNNVKPPVVYPPEKTLSISGTLTDSYGVAYPNTSVMLIDTDKARVNLIANTVTDKKGRFAFDVDFMDSTKFALKTGKINWDNIRVTLDKAPTQINPNKNFPDELVNADEQQTVYLQNSKAEYDKEVKYHIGDHTPMLKQVEITTKRPPTERELKIKRAVEFSSNLNGPGVADQILTAEDLEGRGCPTVVECLRGKLAGVIFDRFGNPHLLRGQSSLGLQTGMTIIVDGMRGTLGDLTPDQISSIEVLKTAGTTTIYGGANGVLVITSKHGGGFIKDERPPPGNISPQGYYKVREFYSPKYEHSKTDMEAGDLRTTIFWQPLLQTDKNGNAVFEYFNADSKGPYRIVIEGIDYQTGNIGRKVFEYKVD